MRLKVSPLALLAAVAALLVACQPVRPADQLPPAPAPMHQTLPWDKYTLDMKIANAMSAGPMAIAKNATILDWPTEASGGEWIVLREGNNGWTCVTDDWAIGYNFPINDPMCMDDTWIQWLKASWAGEDPNITVPGISYMYLGGVAPDNDTPMLAPPAGQEWQVDPPHVMIVFPKGSDLAGLSHDMHMGMPYVMSINSPYVHVMAPIVVESLEPVEPGTAAESRIANAMTAAPTEIGQDATIIDWPTDGTANFPVLREGTNGWTCLPDDNILEQPTLTNDPMCLDAQWLEWLQASFEGREPNITAPGISYMLQGGSVAHNDDPTVLAPAEGDEWQIDPPHIMILNPGGFDENAWSHDHAHGGPYLMFGGTPYEHLMIPVDPVVTGSSAMEHSHTGNQSEAASLTQLPSEKEIGEELMAMEMQWVKCQDEHDVSACDALMTDDYFLILADGSRIGPDSLLAFVADTSISFGELNVITDVSAQSISPDAAVVAYGFEQTQNGAMNRGYQSVGYRKVNGAWVAAFGQVMMLGEAATAITTDKPKLIPENALAKELLAVEDTFWKCQSEKDIATCDAITANDFYVIIGDGSRVSREQYMADIANPDLKWHQPKKITDISTQLLAPDAAVIAYGFEQQVNDDVFLGYNSVFYRKVEGQWQSAFAHFMPLK